MDQNFKDILADGGEVLLDSVINNEVIKEIPILGTSLKLIKGIQNVRDRAYINKVRKFIDCLGNINDKKKKKLIDESRKDEKRRVKFGDAIFTTIDQSDSLVKVEYVAVAFEAFLNDDLSESDLRLICHIIRNSFVDELIDIVENKNQFELKYMVASGLAEINYPILRISSETAEPEYEISMAARQLQEAYLKYKK